MTGAVAWVIVLPLAAGALAFLVRGPRGAWLATAPALGAVWAAAALVGEVWTSGVVRHRVGGWAPPLGIELVADGLSAVMVLTTAILSVVLGVYGWAYFSAPPTGPREGWRAGEAFRSLAFLLWGSLNVLFLGADAFNLYVGLELMTITAVALVVLADGPLVLAAAMRYLLAAFVGSLAYLLGVAILYAGSHALDLSVLAARLEPGAPAWAALALILSGLGVKAALFPLHFWLPRAHASAPAPVSAVLSALVVTAAVYLVLRYWSVLVLPGLGPSAGQLLGGLGAAAIVWGSLGAIRQQRLKLMIAYSTVAQIGYLFLVLPLTTAPGPWAFHAWSGGVYHAVSHALAKASMFLAAGCIVRALGHDRLVGVRGIASHMPVATYAFGIAGMTLIGLPPSGGFVAKWMLLSAAIASGQWWWAIVIVAGGLLTAGYVFLVLGQFMSQASTDAHTEFGPVPRTLEYAAFAVAAVGMLLGLRPAEPLVLLAVGSPFAPLPQGN